MITTGNHNTGSICIQTIIISPLTFFFSPDKSIGKLANFAVPTESIRNKLSLAMYIAACNFSPVHLLMEKSNYY